MIPNPLRDPRDRRLPRVPEPCALVVFGVTGDLARKKLLPGGLRPGQPRAAAARLRAARLRPPRLGRRRLRRPGPRGGPGARPHPVARGGVGAAGRQHHVRARLVRRRRRLRPPGRDPRRAARAATASTATPPSTCPSRRRCSRSCSSRCSAPGWPTTHAAAAGGGSSSRSRSATTCPPAASSTSWSTTCSPPRTSSASTTTWARRPSRTCWRCGSPTRCSSRSGTPTTSTRCRSPWPRTSASAGGPASTTKTGAARDVLQNHLLQLLALTAMEEPVEFSRRGDPHREAQGAARDLAARRTWRPFAVRGQYEQGWLAGQRAVGYRAGGRRRRRTPRPRPTPRSGSGVETRRWAGRAVLPAHRQAAAPPGHRDRAGRSRRRRTCRSPRPTPRSSATTSSSSGCSPTRASP